MNKSPLTERVAKALEGAGYHRIVSPFRVASVEFSFTAVFKGSQKRSNDLVILVDTTTGEDSDRQPERFRNRVEALGRALDVSQSRYVITVILIGATARHEVEILATSCRVLTVDDIPMYSTEAVSEDEKNRRLLDRISVLMPLLLPDASGAADSEGLSAIDQLTSSVAGVIDQSFYETLISASASGEGAVTDEFFRILEKEMITEGGEK